MSQNAKCRMGFLGERPRSLLIDCPDNTGRLELRLLDIAIPASEQKLVAKKSVAACARAARSMSSQHWARP
jgi:hypothetical protein